MNTKFASRKFILVSINQLLLFISLWLGSLPVEAFQTLTITLISGYLLMNVSQRALTKGKAE